MTQAYDDEEFAMTTPEHVAIHPAEQRAIDAMYRAREYLKKNYGWNDIIYCPKDGTHFQIIENGSTGIFDGWYEGQWADGYWMVSDGQDLYVGFTGFSLFRLYPKDLAKQKLAMETAIRNFSKGTDL